MQLTRFCLVVLAALTSGSVACAGDGTFGPGGNPMGNGDGTGMISFAAEVQPIFTARCALSGCHAGPTPQQGMNLSEGLAFSNIVNVPANEVSGLMRVRPNSPDSSYLVHKIEGTQGNVGGSGGRMPLSGCCLAQDQIDLIRTWIGEGAVNN
ncbi:MAG: hypothetical protein ACE5HT_12850 [Gemmatimonadales bacterium]